MQHPAVPSKEEAGGARGTGRGPLERRDLSSDMHIQGSIACCGATAPAPRPEGHMAVTLLQGARPREGVREQDTLIPLPTCGSPARVIGLVACQHLHHHTSHLLVIGNIPEPIGAQDQDIIRAVLILREVVNPDLASNGTRDEGEGQRRLPLHWAHRGSGHPDRLQLLQEPLGTERPAARLTSGKQDRKGLMWMLELNTLRSWSPRPRVTPIVAITRAWRTAKSEENFKPLHPPPFPAENR